MTDFVHPFSVLKKENKIRLLKDPDPEEEKFYAEGAEEVEEEIAKYDRR